MTRTVVLTNRMMEAMLSGPEALEGLAASVQAMSPEALADAFVSLLGAQLRLILPSVLIPGSFFGGGLTYYFTPAAAAQEGRGGPALSPGARLAHAPGHGHRPGGHGPAGLFRGPVWLGGL